MVEPDEDTAGMVASAEIDRLLHLLLVASVRGRDRSGVTSAGIPQLRPGSLLGRRSKKNNRKFAEET